VVARLTALLVRYREQGYSRPMTPQREGTHDIQACKPPPDAAAFAAFLSGSAGAGAQVPSGDAGAEKEVYKTIGTFD